ncbi:unnamed protein product [Oppiella nova]|uniref:Uncharacterized protein n=1 Tax=Oppiella nova TaxID=334625 RepID=A0A7R9MPU3_9ACAR|nr:unnamed protein product [Oppiella nova]CAG2181326.1 unnamed protein product [Oppiella nova]
MVKIWIALVSALVLVSAKPTDDLETIANNMISKIPAHFGGKADTNAIHILTIFISYQKY